jgi:hypothetical protein
MTDSLEPPRAAKQRPLQDIVRSVGRRNAGPIPAREYHRAATNKGQSFRPAFRRGRASSAEVQNLIGYGCRVQKNDTARHYEVSANISPEPSALTLS